MPPPDKDQLQKVIKEMVAKIARYKGAVFNEQDTKAALIKPVLEALGWDTSDPEQVRHEFKTNPKDNPVDYALLDMRQPRLMVEAKGLGESLDDPKWVGQTLGYAAVGGAPWCVLTNGEEYRIYNATAPVAAAEKLLCKVRLTADPVEQAAQLLGLISRANLGGNLIEMLWKAQHIDRKVGAALQQLFATPDGRLVGLIRSKESGLAPKDVLNSLRRLTIRVEQPPLQYPVGRVKPAAAKRTSTQVAKPKKSRPQKSPRVYGVELADLIATSSAAARAVGLPSRSSFWVRVPPPTNSRAKNGRPSWVPNSWTWTTCGWSSAATASASTRNRTRASGSWYLPPRIILMAAGRLSRWCRAR
ncbi:MAG TPA: hypothetical protein VKE74_33125 [Gemmataceae bacterium]|nr:hypothetical protein [Gemmataceae bacterium]